MSTVLDTDIAVLCNLLHSHRLNDSSNIVLTVKPRSYGKGGKLDFYKIKTPERTEVKFGTVDYVHKTCLKTKLGDNQTYCHYTHDTVHTTESNYIESISLNQSASLITTTIFHI